MPESLSRTSPNAWEVSRATVSAVLSGRRFVTPELKQKILAAIEDLQYVPDNIARSMKTNRTMTIGLVLPNILSPIWATIARGAADVARLAGYSTIMYDTDERSEIMQAALRTLQEKRVDGIILAPCGDGLSLLSSFLGRAMTPVVLIDRSLKGLALDSIVSDDMDGAYQATRHFIQTGHCRVGLINLPAAISTGRNRLEGYFKALNEGGISIEADLIKTGGRGQDEGYQRAQELFDLPRSKRPDALLVSSHLMAIGAMHAAREQDLNIPADIGLAGFDDTPWAPLLDPPLTVVHQPAYEMGCKAAEVLQMRIDADVVVDDPQQIVLPTRLVHRRSCCRPAADTDAK